MKKTLILLNTLHASYYLLAQGTFVYDQQSVSSDARIGESLFDIQSNQPIGQSFSPTLSSIDFIRLLLADREFNTVGATVLVNLRANSITGPILASTTPLFMPDGFAGVTNFLFAGSVPITPGTTYYFQPVVQSGVPWGIVNDIHFMYSGGTMFSSGQVVSDADLWFREGIIVPEPSALGLLAIGLSVVLHHRARCRFGPPCTRDEN